MAGNLELVDPNKIKPNPENPRLIFREDELITLQESIKNQGILVPLTLYSDGKKHFVLLDGERRWRCALKLGLPRVPVIIQPKPGKLQNLMMMFAVHNARRDWDPLPTAYKLQELERLFEKQNERKPKEKELAELASIAIGELRRLKKLLALPDMYRAELMSELQKPRSQQIITVDHVLESTKAAGLLKKRGVVDDEGEESLRRVILEKFRAKIEKNTVAPRMLARLAQAVQRKEIPVNDASRVVRRLIAEPAYTIEAAFNDSAANSDFEHVMDQLADRLSARILEHRSRKYQMSQALHEKLVRLGQQLLAIN